MQHEIANAEHRAALEAVASEERASPTEGTIGSVPTLRVLILSRHPAQQGGVVNYLQLLVRRFDPSITSEILVTGRRPGESGALRAAMRLCADFLRFSWRIAGGQYDIVHLNPSLDARSTLREAAFLAILKLMLFHRTVVFFRGWEVELERRIARHAIYRLPFRWLFGTAGQILVLSSRFEHALRAFGCRCPIEVVTTMFDGRALVQVLEERLPTPKPVSILYLSRFVREKGVYELINAFAALAARYPDLTLVMAGDGPETIGLKNAAENLGLAERVQFPGYLRGLDKARAFANTRIFVLATSYPEGLPNALLEALAAGHVVVTTRVGGIPDVIDDPENGVLLDEVTADSIGAALERVLGDHDYCRRVRGNNIAKAWGHYEAAIVTRRIESVYIRLAHRVRQAPTRQWTTPHDDIT